MQTSLKHPDEVSNLPEGYTFPESDPGISRVASWLLVGALSAIVLLVLARPVCSCSPVRSKVSRARTDHRALAVALESYYIDHGSYPPSTLRRGETFDRDQYPKRIKLTGRTFRAARNGAAFATLTTPVCYLASYSPDPHAGDGRLGYRYYTDGSTGWILGSYGPDQDLARGGQLEWELGDNRISNPEKGIQPDSAVERIYDTRISQPSLVLITGGGPRGAFTYDPTNGTASAGDLWRVKQ